MMGGNLGLPTYQVALGFSGDPNPPEAQHFADIVVKANHGVPSACLSTKDAAACAV
jgi:hypothetical protein